MPQQVALGYRTWRVIKQECGDNGQCVYDKQRVIVSTGMPPDDEANTLIHELLHAACHEGSLFPDAGGETEERIVTVLANAITEVWKRNPEVIAYLNDRLGDP